MWLFFTCICKLLKLTGTRKCIHQVIVFWDIQCRINLFQCFGETCSLHLQGDWITFIWLLMWCKSELLQGKGSRFYVHSIVSVPSSLSIVLFGHNPCNLPIQKYSRVLLIFLHNHQKGWGICHIMTQASRCLLQRS